MVDSNSSSSSSSKHFRYERFLPHVSTNRVQVRGLAQAAAAEAAALHTSRAQGPKTPSQAQAYAHARDQAVRVQAAHGLEGIGAQAWVGGSVLGGVLGVRNGKIKKRRYKVGAESAEEAVKHLEILRKLLNEPPGVSGEGCM